VIAFLIKRAYLIIVIQILLLTALAISPSIIIAFLLGANTVAITILISNEVSSNKST
jgi:hypothetical protein